MLPRYKSGLIVGVVGAVINLGVASLIGICGPFFGLLVGAAAGFWTARSEKAASRGDAAKAAAVSGAIAGAFMIVAQVIAAAITLIVSKSNGTISMFMPQTNPLSPETTQTLMWASGLGAGFCFGILDLLAAALAAAAAGYLATPNPVPSAGDPLSPQ
jgi:hypothetical protein